MARKRKFHYDAPESITGTGRLDAVATLVYTEDNYLLAAMARGRLKELEGGGLLPGQDLEIKGLKMFLKGTMTGTNDFWDS